MIYRLLPSGMAAYSLKLQNYLLCTFIMTIVPEMKGFTLACSPIAQGPLLISKKIIYTQPENCGTGTCIRMLKACMPGEDTGRQHPSCFLFGSPGLTFDSPGRDERVVNDHLSPENAIAFPGNHCGYAMLEDARDLLQVNRKANIASMDNPGINDKLKRREKNYPDNISMQKALNESYEFSGMQEQKQTGLVTYEPYLLFKRIRIKFPRSPLSLHSTYKSSIEITEPGRNTVWVLNEPVALQWSTYNIPADKSLRFFLVKGEMVVQELGTFKNSGVAQGIRLNKNIDSGDDYRVVGIELFPDNTTNIAKMATPFFSIRRPERRKKAVVSPATPTVTTDAPATERMSFEGRNINYVKELTVNHKEIRISIWDHGRQDRDIVSIYLNGEPVVSRHSLTYRKTHFELVLDTAGKNDLFLYAHNLGIYPPNTVSIEIVDGDSSENIVLNSDLKSCEAVLINVIQ